MPRNAPPAAMVGLDVGADSIKVVEAKYGKDGITITGLGMARTPEGVISNEVIVDPKALGAAIKALLAESGIKTKQVTSSVAGQSRVVIRVIEVPKMADQELAETMKWEVERQVPFPPNEVVMDYQPLEKAGSPSGQNMEVLLAVAQEELIQSHCQTLQAAGLKPVAIDIEPLAAGRSLLRGSSFGSSTEVVAIVNIGSADTDLGVFENGQLAFPSPPLSIAGESFTREISETLGQTMEQAETTKKEYAAVKLNGFPQAQPDEPDQPAAADGAAQTIGESVFNTTISPGTPFASAFDLGGAPAADSGLAAEPANLNDFQTTIDGPVFDMPEMSFGAAPGGPSFDLGDDTPTAPAPAEPVLAPAEPLAAEAADLSDLTPSGPVFDLDDEPAHEAEQANPSFDLSDADVHADPGDEAAPKPATPVAASDDHVDEQVFGAIAGVLVDFATELRRSIEYYSTRYSRQPDKVLICGGTAKMPHLDEFLTSELGVPVEVADPVKKMPVKVAGVSDRYLHEISPMFSVAIGLAIRDMVS
jgi:type IV pilus assembly protein PilM